MIPPSALRLLSCLFVVAALVALAAAPAAAHSVLQSTTPGDGQVLEGPPDEIRLDFNEPVTAAFGAIRVYDQTGAQLVADEASVVEGDPSQLRVPLPVDLPIGTFVTTWAVTSPDSHPVEGAFVFDVGEATADQSFVETIFARSRRGDVPLNLAASVLRALVYAGTLLAAGGAVFLLWTGLRDDAERRALARVPMIAAWVGIAASVLGLAVQGALLSGGGPAALADPTVLGAVARTTFGVSTLVRLAGLATLLVFLPRPGSRAAIGAGLAAALGSFALTGHTVATEPRWLVTVADIAHTTAAASWLGGLAVMLVALRRRRAADDAPGGGRIVARFSTLATAALVGVAVAGSALAWAQVRALRALTTTAYGWTLLAKVGVVLLVVAVAAYNNRRLVPAIRRGGHAAWPILRRTVRYEVAGLLVVVALTGFLVNLRPARSEAGVGEPFTRYVQLGEEYQVNLTVDPNVAGVNEVHLYLLGRDGRPADVARELTLDFSMPANDIAPIIRTPEVVGPGHWLVTGPEMSIPGSWLIEVNARIGEFEQATAEVTVTVNS